MKRPSLVLVCVGVCLVSALASHNGVIWEQIHDTYTRQIVIRPNAAVLGPTAPNAATVGTFRGLAFDADAEQLFVEAYIPADWDGESDLTITLCWCPEVGDPMTNGETVKWEGSYRVITPGDSLTTGAAVPCSETYTQSGTSKETELICCSTTIDYDHADQPVTAGDLLGWIISRDKAGDSYAGDAIVILIRISYQANKLGR